MERTTTSALLISLVAGILLIGAQAEPAAAITVAGGTPEQHQMAEWAVARFTAAGLALPPVAISFEGRDLSRCGGSRAKAYLDRSPAQVVICWNDELILLHELAHVWEAQAVPPSLHEPFMAMREGVESWMGGDVPWEQQGREHAANVIAWGLLEDPYPLSRTYPNDPDSLAAAFEFLTGTEPLHDGGPGIRIPDRSQYSGGQNPPLESGR